VQRAVALCRGVGCPHKLLFSLAACGGEQEEMREAGFQGATAPWNPAQRKTLRLFIKQRVRIEINRRFKDGILG